MSTASPSSKLPPSGIPPATPKDNLFRRLARRGTWLFILLIAVLAALPTVVARTSLRHQLLSLTRPGVPDGATIGQASLGWMSPIVFRDVRIPDLLGRPMLVVGEVRTDRPLWELATAPDDIGRITVENLDCRVIRSDDGTNLTDVLRQLRGTPARRPRPRLRLECHAGSLSLEDAAGSTLIACKQIEVLFDDLRPGDAPAVLSLDAITSVPTRDGRFNLAAAWSPAMGGTDAIQPGKVRCVVEHWPLDPILPAVQQPLGLSALAGAVSLTLDADWTRLSSAGGDARLSLVLQSLEGVLLTAEPAAKPFTFETRDAQLQLTGVYDGSADRLELADSQLHTQWLDATVQGSLSDIGGELLCDVTGDVVVNLQTVAEMLSSHVMQEVRMEGVETRRITVRGPLRPGLNTTDAPNDDRLSVQADVVWRLLEAVGISSADAQTRFTYADSRIDAIPIHVPVSGGRVGSIPAFEFAASGPLLHFDGGPLLERVAFSETMCRGWMRYLSPLMANTTSIDGTFTLTVDTTAMSVRQWPQSDLQGTLSIHAARVGPGPLTQQLLAVVRQFQIVADRTATSSDESEGTWLTVSEQQVPFVIQAGRVEHRNLRLSVGQVQLESSGSVGLEDDSLDLLLVVHFPENWFRNRPLLAGLQQDGLRIPIRGTLGNPQIEARPLRDLGRGIGVRAVDGVLRRLLESDERK